jgi:hypothetical protein
MACVTAGCAAPVFPDGVPRACATAWPSWPNRSDRAADDVGPVQGGRAVPQRGQRVEVNQAFVEDGRLQVYGQHAAARR